MLIYTSFAPPLLCILHILLYILFKTLLLNVGIQPQWPFWNCVKHLPPSLLFPFFLPSPLPSLLPFLPPLLPFPTMMPAVLFANWLFAADFCKAVLQNSSEGGTGGHDASPTACVILTKLNPSKAGCPEMVRPPLQDEGIWPIWAECRLHLLLWFFLRYPCFSKIISPLFLIAGFWNTSFLSTWNLRHVDNVSFSYSF